jgi:hypothetical protein
MTPFEHLLLIARLQHEENDFPTYLLGEVEDLLVAGTLAGRETLVEELTTQIENFDPYAGTGCFGESCSAATIAATLRKVKKGGP